MKHIALFLPSLLGGGAERVMVTLANGFAEKGFSVDLVLVKQEGPYLSEVSSSVRIVDLKCSRVLFACFKLASYLRWAKPEIILSTLEHANIIAIWSKMLTAGKTKCVIRMPSTISVNVKYTNSFREKIIPWCLKFFYPWIDAIVVVSKVSAQDLVKFLGIGSSKVFLIYNPVVDDELFKKANMELNHPWFTDKRIPVILGVGRLSKAKDFATLIRAFALLREKQLVRLLILGDGEDRKQLEILISKLGVQEDVLLHGFVENPFPYMKQAAVFALSSRWEGLPNALIQAIALGTPVVATDCPGGTAEILEDNRLGILVPMGDEQKFADALQKSLDSKKMFVDTGMDRFKSDAIINQYLRLMKSL